MARRVIIERGGNAREVDQDIKNKWNWSWIEKVDHSGTLFSVYIRKLNKPGIALCVWCDTEISYSSRGSQSMLSHSKTAKHVSKAKLLSSNYRLPSTATPSTSNDCHAKSDQPRVPYGIHPMFANANVKTVANMTPSTTTPVSDRTMNNEAKLVAFAAEKGIPLSIVGDMLSLCKNLSLDPQSFNKMTVDRTSATYKLKYGVAKTMQEKLIKDLQSHFFSLNIDEATTKNSHEKFLTVLVSFFDESVGEVVLHYLDSLRLVKATSVSILEALVNLFEEKCLPWANLTSILMDSCNVMRGSKSGLEVLIREKYAPHLLDIDGDTCHHAHNASKKLCGPLQGVAEKLFFDLYMDFKWSPDLREFLESICLALDIPYVKPPRYVPHRWLSVLNVSITTHSMIDAYIILYSCLTPNTKAVTEVTSRVLNSRKVKEGNMSAISALANPISKKNMTKEGKERKERIASILFEENTYLEMTLAFYGSVLPLLKSYVCLFESKEPMIHMLHEKQIELYSNFLRCFIQPSSLETINIVKADISNLNLLDQKDMFVGSRCKAILNRSKSSSCNRMFLSRVQEGYVACAKYLQKKMPLSNPLIKAISFIDPQTTASPDLSLKYLAKLPQLVSHVLKGEELDGYDLEVRKFNGTALPPFGKSQRIDSWWWQVNQTGKFPNMCKVVFAVISYFHGPLVENSFSVMNNVIDDKATRMDVSTYNAIQTVKYSLKAAKKTSIEYFHKADHLHEAVCPMLVKNMSSARNEYGKNLQAKREAGSERRSLLGGPSSSVKRTATESETSASDAKKPKLLHTS